MGGPQSFSSVHRDLRVCTKRTVESQVHGFFHVNLHPWKTSRREFKRRFSKKLQLAHRICNKTCAIGLENQPNCQKTCLRGSKAILQKLKTALVHIWILLWKWCRMAICVLCKIIERHNKAYALEIMLVFNLLSCSTTIVVGLKAAPPTLQELVLTFSPLEGLNAWTEINKSRGCNQSSVMKPLKAVAKLKKFKKTFSQASSASLPLLQIAHQWDEMKRLWRDQRHLHWPTCVAASLHCKLFGVLTKF